jgi:uncharacterized protein (DUF1778 family)
VNLRMPRRLRGMIDDAAAATGKTRTDFILESSRKQAADVLLDRRVFRLGEKQYAAFLSALDAPPAPDAKLKRLMASKSPSCFG